MSNSRLEKFIYAICGMDVGDLPTPLSRIETLWNCLITGGMPDFEPLSRNEKYLMAMLTDNVDGLPEPTSRGEKLLYKIATGETDLSDVPGYLSRYEELLKQLIENGGIGGTDFEYVLYTLNDSFSTLYSTAEAPVRSAILKGNTLVNLVKESSEIKIVGKASSTLAKYQVNHIDITKDYTVLFEINDFNGSGNISFSLGTQSKGISLEEVNHNGKFNILIPSSKIGSEMNEIWFYWTNGNWVDGNTATIKNIILIEGDYTNVDIPYFEGMQSVKMPVLTTTGKNLLNDSTSISGWVSDTGVVIKHGTIGEKANYLSDYIFVEDMQKLKVNRPVWVWKFDANKNFISKYSTGTADIDVSDCSYIIIGVSCGGEHATSLIGKIQVEQGTVATPYEPHKSNILTVNEEVELRGIGDVKDELNCLTGELTERIGEITLDGSKDENWVSLGLSGTGNSIGFYIPINNKKSVVVKCDKLPLTNYDDIAGIKQGGSESVLQIRMTTEYLTSLDLNSFKIWLAQNPLTVQYKLATESVKTVVLSTLDQDGQPTKLSTFNDITHVSIEAEDLLPTVDLEVATKIEETLSTLPTLINDISETQQLLNESIDDQAENINEVSTAMAEIRSDIL